MKRRLLLAAAVLAASALPLASPSPSAASDPRTIASMSVDRVVVAPGGTITYGVRADNLGPGDLPAARTESHYPVGTTATGSACRNGTFEPNGDICVAPEAPTPGLGDSAWQVGQTRAPFPADDGFTMVFSVRVNDDTAPGTVITNVGRLITDDGTITTGTVRTLVVASAPPAFTGYSELQLDDETTTDSYDHRSGWSASTATVGGDVGSNGELELDDDVVVGGDVLLGPAAQLDRDDDAVVLGAVRRVPTMVPGPLDGTSHVGRDSSRTICRAAWSCPNSSWDPLTRRLVVRGTATLPAGTHVLCSLDLDGSLVAQGRVNLWFGSAATCPGGSGLEVEKHSVLRPSSGDPTDLVVRSQDPTTKFALERATVTAAFEVAGRLRLHHGQLFGWARADELIAYHDVALHADRSTS